MTKWIYRKARMTEPFHKTSVGESFDKHVATGPIWEELGRNGWELVSTEKEGSDVWGFFRKPK